MKWINVSKARRASSWVGETGVEPGLGEEKPLEDKLGVVDESGGPIEPLLL
jgi:hypothetical protein